jgi:hypothetical protein
VQLGLLGSNFCTAEFTIVISPFYAGISAMAIKTCQPCGNHWILDNNLLDLRMESRDIPWAMWPMADGR